MAIVEAIVNGERNPRQLARLRDNRIKADEATIAQSLEGHWREEHIFVLTQALELYRFYHDKIGECDREIEAQLERLEDRSVGRPPPAHVNKRGQGNAPRFDIRTHLYRMTGVDLTPDRWRGRFRRQCPAPLRQRFGRFPAPEESAIGRAQGHCRHRPQTGQTDLFHAPVRTGIRGCRAEYYDTQYQQRALRAAKRRAAQLGYRLVPMSDEQIDHTTRAPIGAPIAA